VRDGARGASRRVAWVGAAAVAAGVAVVAVRAESGCTTHQCDPDSLSMGTPVACMDGGAMDRCEGGNGFGTAYLSGREIVWESSGQDDAWLDYRGSRTFFLDWSEAVACQLGIDPCTLQNDYVVTDWEPYVSTYQQNSNQNSVLASGQLAELTCLSPSGMCITNGTCERYYLRVVVRLVPNLDAGRELEAAVGDATTDAPRAD
jgi:hypothetical protein